MPGIIYNVLGLTIVALSVATLDAPLWVSLGAGLGVAVLVTLALGTIMGRS